MSKADVTTRFPFINLEKALNRTKQLYTNDNKGRPMAVPTAFAAWGYSEKSSGGHQTVAALKMYGLVLDSGSNDDRRIQLSDNALQYFQEEREDQQKELVQQFALYPKLVEAVWNEWGASPPSDAVARSQLKIDRKLNEQSARSFLGIYKDNLSFAELTNSGSLKSDNPDDIVKAKIGDFVQWSSNGINQFSPPRRVRLVSDDFSWVFVDDSTTGIPMNEISIEQSAPAANAPPAVPPTMPLPQVGVTDAIEKMVVGEKEWVRTPLGKGAYARILVTDDLSDTQIEKLRIVLEAMKEE